MTFFGSGFGFVLVTIAAVIAIIVVTLTVTGIPLHRVVGRRAVQWSMLMRQRDMAEILGVDHRVWLTMRVLAAVATVGIAASQDLPAIFISLAAVLGWVGLPWLMGLEHNRRRLRLDAAWVELERDISDRLKARTPLNRILRDLGANPPPLLAQALQPLADPDLDLAQALAEVQRRTRSGIGNRLTAYLVCGLKKDVVTFARLLPDVIDEFLADTREVHRSHGKLVRRALGTTTIFAGLLVVEFTALARSSGSFHDFYASPTGALFMGAVAACFVVIVHLIRRIYRLPHHTNWNVPRLVSLLRRYS